MGGRIRRLFARTLILGHLADNFSVFLVLIVDLTDDPSVGDSSLVNNVLHDQIVKLIPSYFFIELMLN